MTVLPFNFLPGHNNAYHLVTILPGFQGSHNIRSLLYLLHPFTVPMGDPKGQSTDGDLDGGGRPERRPDAGHDPLLRSPRQRAHQDGARHLDVLQLAGARMLRRGGRVREVKCP